MTGCELNVVIPCHNDGKYLSEAIESVLGQEHRLRSFEVVVVDDHSTDEETREVLEHWALEDPTVRVLRNTRVGGPATARNVGVAAAAGEWVAFLDADDVWLPGGLQARWEVVEAQAGSGSARTSRSGTRTAHWKRPATTTRMTSSGGSWRRRTARGAR